MFMEYSLMEITRKIYNAIADEESKRVFENRVMYSLTKDGKYLMNLIRSVDLYKSIRKAFEGETRKKYIFGAGIRGRYLVDLFSDVSFEAFIDSFATGSVNGLEIISFDDFIKGDDGDSVIYISALKYQHEQYEQLIAAGISEKRIVNIAKMQADFWYERQYFDLPQLIEQMAEREVFIDGGCYDAANSLRFMEFAKDKEAYIYAFEPDEENLILCEDKLNQVCNGNFTLFQKGLWSEETILSFSSGENVASHLSENGNIKVPVADIDSVVNDKVTFIKMDIEGSECEAIKGAQNTIKTYKPRLAISVYHKLEDIWSIPKLILELNPNYKLYFRHYSIAGDETVLYAIEQK